MSRNINQETKESKEEELNHNNNNKKNKMDFVWDKCCELYLKGRNGNIQSLYELEEISNNNCGDIICLYYFYLLMERFPHIFNKEKLNQTSLQIQEILSNQNINTTSISSTNTNTNTNTNTIGDHLSTLTNKHEQYI